MQDWAFGCDICQDVCPWNSRAPRSRDSQFEPRSDSNPIDLIALFELDDAAFHARFRHTPLWRPRRRGMLRNAAIVLGNTPTICAIPALVRGLNDDESLVRGACAWALGQYATSAASESLEARLLIEADAGVLGEIERALRAQLTGTRQTGQN
jgi:epoxyqueuosine reductase